METTHQTIVPTCRVIEHRPLSEVISEAWERLNDLPAWVHIASGGAIAAMTGALLGGALHV